MLVGKLFTLSNTDQVYGNAYAVIIFSRTTFIHGGQPKSDQWLSAGQLVFHTLSWTLLTNLKENIMNILCYDKHVILLNNL